MKQWGKPRPARTSTAFWKFRRVIRRSNDLLQGDAQVHVQDVHVLGDKVAVEGTISVNALYVGRGDMGDGEVYSVHWPDAINFDIEIQLPGAEPGLDRHVDASVPQSGI